MVAGSTKFKCVRISYLYILLTLIYSWLALARLEAKLGNLDRAREVFRESTVRCPNNVHILHAWGHLEQVSEVHLK